MNVNSIAASGALPSASSGRDPLQRLCVRLVDEIECGMIVCDDVGSVHFANHAAQIELACGGPLRRIGDRLCVADGADGDLLPALRMAVHKSRRRLVHISLDGDRLLVSVIPLEASESAGPRALVLLGRRRLCTELGLQMLGSAYGLTLAERRVLAALLADATPAEIARAHEVQLSTVRTQIASVRQKLGARSIDGLLLRVAAMPPVASALRLASTAGHAVASPGWRAAA